MSSVNEMTLDSPLRKAMLPFWQANQKQLHMRFCEEGGNIVVVGYDPAAAAADRSKSLFCVILRAEQREAFIKAVREGHQAEPITSVEGALAAIVKVVEAVFKAAVEGPLDAFIEAVEAAFMEAVEVTARASNTNEVTASASNTNETTTLISNSVITIGPKTEGPDPSLRELSLDDQRAVA